MVKKIPIREKTWEKMALDTTYGAKLIVGLEPPIAFSCGGEGNAPIDNGDDGRAMGSWVRIAPSQTALSGVEQTIILKKKK